MKEGLHLGGGLLLLPPEVDTYSLTTAPSRAPKLRRQISKRAMASRIRGGRNHQKLIKKDHVPKQYLLTKLPGGRWTRVHNHKIGLGHVEAHGAGGGAAQSKDFSNIKEKSMNTL